MKVKNIIKLEELANLVGELSSSMQKLSTFGEYIPIEIFDETYY